MEYTSTRLTFWFGLIFVVVVYLPTIFLWFSDHNPHFSFEERLLGWNDASLGLLSAIFPAVWTHCGVDKRMRPLHREERAERERDGREESCKELDSCLMLDLPRSS